MSWRESWSMVGLSFVFAIGLDAYMRGLLPQSLPLVLLALAPVAPAAVRVVRAMTRDELSDADRARVRARHPIMAQLLDPASASRVRGVIAFVGALLTLLVALQYAGHSRTPGTTTLELSLWLAGYVVLALGYDWLIVAGRRLPESLQGNDAPGLLAEERAP